jgi:hypothetical protein
VSQTDRQTVGIRDSKRRHIAAVRPHRFRWRLAHGAGRLAALAAADEAGVQAQAMLVEETFKALFPQQYEATVGPVLSSSHVWTYKGIEGMMILFKDPRCPVLHAK